MPVAADCSRFLECKLLVYAGGMCPWRSVRFWHRYRNLRGKQLVVTFFNTMLALPTVVIGLLVYSLLSRRGVFGSLGWLYTQKAMIFGQIILVTPIVVAFTISAVSRIDVRYRRTALTLGASSWQAAMVVLRSVRFSIVAAIVAAFGRVISEIGISMMLGGNARGFTRTMTTAMALEYDKGEFVLALALGIVLLLISLGVNMMLGYFQGKNQVSLYTRKCRHDIRWA